MLTQGPRPWLAGMYHLLQTVVMNETDVKIFADGLCGYSVHISLMQSRRVTPSPQNTVTSILCVHQHMEQTLIPGGLLSLVVPQGI